MSRGPEGKFKSAVDAKLPLDVHHQAMTLMYANGTADRYYEGPKSHLWVEYKWVKAKTLRRVVTPMDLCKPLQRHWLRRAARNRQPVWVVVAGPGWVHVAGPQSWDQPVETSEGNAATAALLIEDVCKGRTDP